MKLTGVYAPVPTPFDHDEQVDIGRIRSAFARWLATRLSGFVVLGTNGEAGLLDEEESDLVIETVRALVPRDRTLIAGTGRESTQGTVRACKRAALLGADAVLVRTPSFFKPQMTADAFVGHYLRVADASPVPVLLYNVSMFTGVNLTPDAVERLAVHANIVGMKESGSDAAAFSELVARTPDEFTVLAGSATTMFHAFCAGCDGGVLALASLVPGACVELLALVRQNRLDDARRLQRRVMPLARAIGGSHGVAGLKAAMDIIGLEGGYPRPPLKPVSADVVEQLRGELAVLDVPSFKDAGVEDPARFQKA